ncbi:hypothetical protein BGAL_0607g00080 [Botrytis galanthina]|uniref:Uncharacterized protein n=1 Tax=Botrytis galanthina TaxID=278940 RepID=A0A4S8QV60_9HELO|nr:hypothetical protein BGAL_0607g00080 [Botrytis galanthina]
MAFQDASMTSGHQSTSTVPEFFSNLVLPSEMYAAPQVMSKKSATLAGNHKRDSCKSSELKVWKGGVSSPVRLVNEANGQVNE